MLRVPVALLACTMALLVVAATHTPYGRCDGGEHPALGIVEATAGSADATVYLDDRNYAFGNGIWAYVETNDVWSPKLPGVFANDVADHDLQRGGPCGAAPMDGGDECTIPDDNEICVDDPNIRPDLLLF